MNKIHFMTQGCSANQADTEIMAGLLMENDYLIVEDLNDAELVVFNTCTVKGPTESNFKKKLKELDRLGKKIVIAGCIPQAEKDADVVKQYSCIGPREVDKIVEVVENTLEGQVVSKLGDSGESRLNLPKRRKNRLIEIVPIAQGCLGSCNYCKTKQARGNLVSVPIKEIIRHVTCAVSEGAKEIWLTSQDNGCYGYDLKTNIVELLKEVVKIKGNFKVRVGMANPNSILDFLEDLIEIMKDDKVYKFIHIPLQAGSNKVLKDMNRQYGVEDFVYIVHKLRKEIPEITILTDIICGYPTESKEDFEETIRVIKETKPDLMNISRFWPRPKTKAAKLKPVPTNELKRRTRETTTLFHKIAKEINNSWIGWEGKVLIIQHGKNNTSVGMNSSYKQVVLKERISLGTERNVKINNSKEFYLEGI